MKRAFKILLYTCAGAVGLFTILFIVLFILAAVGVLPDPPEEKTKSTPVEKVGEPEAKPIEVKEAIPSQIEPEPPPQPKMLVWNKTPAEQGLKVGDWIIAQGQANSYIGAQAVRPGDRNHELFDHNLSDIDPRTGKYLIRTIRGGNVLQVFKLDYSGASYFQLESPEKDLLSPKIKIGLVTVMSIPDPRQSPVLKQYNLLRFHEKGDITELIVSGQITKIHEPSTVEGVVFEYVDIEYHEGGTLQLTATDAEVAQAMKEATANAVAVKQDFLQLSEQFSAWNGSHYNTVAFIKKNMHNPKSFEHVETTFTTNKKEGFRIIQMKYRGTNAFNAIVTNTVWVKVDLKGNVLGVLKTD